MTSQSVRVFITQNLKTSNRYKIMSATFQFKHDYPELAKEYDFPSKSITCESVNVVITHGGCTDGFTSRVAFEKAVRENPSRFHTKLEDMIFIDAYYGQKPHAIDKLIESIRGKVVLICDFSYQPDVFQEMIEATNGYILVLDHHKTARSNFEGIDPKYAVFDMNHSGAFLMHTFIHGFMNVPKAILYVEDHDIWKKKLPNTDEFSAFSHLQPFEYDSYVKLFDDDFVEASAIPIGVGALMQNQAHIDKILWKTVITFQEIKGKYFFIANVNCAGILQSDLGNQAMKKYGNVNVAFCYSHYKGTTSGSLRSLEDRTDASYIAEQFGGGGHRNAAGVGIDSVETHLPGKIVGDRNAYDLLGCVSDVETKLGKYLILNSSAYKTSLVNYLMQERYTTSVQDSKKNQKRWENDLPGPQEGMFVMRENWKVTHPPRDGCEDRVDSSQEIDDHYIGAVCWHYNANTKRWNIAMKVLPNHVDTVRDTLKIFAARYELDNLLVNVPIFEFNEYNGVFYCDFKSNGYFGGVEEFMKKYCFSGVEVQL